MKNNSSEAFEALKVYMKENHNAKIVSGGREILKRCHICGDSRDPTDAHMYIGLKDNGTIVYNCFKCGGSNGNGSGIVDGKFLRDMGCYDPYIISLCQEQNSKFLSSTNPQFGSIKRINPRTLMVPFFSNAFAQKKLRYINNRLRLSLTTYDLAKNKIVLNLKEFLLANGITNFTRSEEMIDLLDKFFIGFLSCDNRYVILRRLVPEDKLPECIDERYINYNIFNSTGNKFFIIPSTINTMQPISIHIAEGAFDILSICHNIRRNHNPNSIYAAVCGKNYLSLVKYFILSYGLTSFELHLYPDMDVPEYEMIRIREETRVFDIKCVIHRNLYPGEKDFGVSIDKINETYYEL